MIQMFKSEIIIGIISVATAAVAAGTSEMSGGGGWKDFIELGTLAIVLIVLMSYLFRVFLPRWQDSNDKRFEELKELFTEELKAAREEAERQRQTTREIFDQLRNDNRAALDTVADRFNKTLDKIADGNREIWKQERDRFTESYSRLEKAMEKLCDTVCDALSRIQNQTQPPTK